LWWIIVVSIIGGLIVLGTLLLSIPFDLACRFEFYGKAEFNLRWAWFFGLLSRYIKPGKGKSERPQARRKFDLSRILQRIRSASEFLRIKGLMAQFLRLVKRVFRSLKIRKLEVEFTAGLDDPSENFYLFAITEPFNQLINYIQPYPVSIRSSFVGPVFEGHAYGSIRIYPIRLVLPVAQFILSPPVFRLMRSMVAARWKRNK
jgi:hypothetical protein